MRLELDAFRKPAARNTDDRMGRGSGYCFAGGAFLIGTHNRWRKTVVECEIDGSVKNKKRRRIKLIAKKNNTDERRPWHEGPKELERIRKWMTGF
jgi:hypothetical protein